ncbi:MAG TPA: TMEM175 family protein [Ktedonobacterales bacterium]|nr:TMEM175 family protein [Ktedonobacterales bacterium]
MSIHYNRIAGQSLDRLAALSDGIFAVAATLLVLNLHVPLSSTKNPITDESGLWLALTGLAPNLLTYFMSFLTLGIFWVGQQTQLNYFQRSDRHLTWIHLAFLLIVTLMPFSTSLLATFITFRLALVIYWFNIFLLGALLFASWRYAEHAGLVRDDMPAEMRSANTRRILIAQSLYAFGALLCIISTYVSIGFIVLVQLNYAIAPPIRYLSRL